MKKFSIIVLLVFLVARPAFAQETDLSTAIPSTLQRDIKVSDTVTDGSYPNNPVIPGISSTTGLPSTNTMYLPVLCQIDNSVGALPQWGLAAADIMYEMPISGSGGTRLTALFSDQYPTEAGPVRSARVMHADLREEWDALYLHFGAQNDTGSSFSEAIRKYKVNAKGLEIDGTGNKYNKYFPRTRYHSAPHNVSAHVSELAALISQNGYQVVPRPFLFTDTLNYSGPDAVKIDIIHNNNEDSFSTFVYDVNQNYYLRFIIGGIYKDLLAPETLLTYNNIIIQRTKLTFNGYGAAPMLRDVVGGGAADIFIGGKYIAGVWKRTSAQSRTVFFDGEGKEIELQRGRTWIMITNEKTTVSFEGAYDAETAAYYNDTGRLPLYMDLKLGDRGDEVLSLKQRLYELGFIKSKQFNNQYAESTMDAVRQFESQNGLPEDGIADSKVLELIFKGTKFDAQSGVLPEEDSTVLQEDAELPEEDVIVLTESVELPEGDAIVVTESAELPDEGTIVLAESVETGERSTNDVTLETQGQIEPEILFTESESSIVNNAEKDETPEDDKIMDSLDDDLTAVVRTGNKGPLNMRKNADKSSGIIERIPNASLVKVVEKGEDWTRILYKDLEGYVLTSMLVIQDLENSQYDFKILSIGDMGKEVLRLKQRLYELGYFHTDEFSDKFTKDTEEKVMNFKKRNGLPVDGIADVEMQKLLFSSGAK